MNDDDKDARCVSFKLKIFGEGVAMIRMQWIKKNFVNKEFRRVYPRDMKKDEWNEFKIPFYSIIGTKKVSGKID